MMDRVQGSPTSLKEGAPRRLRLVARAGDAPPPFPPRPAEAAKETLAADATLDDALAAILNRCLENCVTHAATLRERYDAEAVHQLRVSLRRLRAFLGLIRDIAPSGERARLAQQAREVASAVGSARDLDVFSEALQREAKPILTDKPSFHALLDTVELRRSKAHEAARAAATAPAALQFESDLRSFIAGRPWRSQAPASQEPGSARSFAVAALRRLRRRMKKRFHDLTDESAAELHQARIAVKKARYGADLFAGAFDADAARAYARQLGKIQDRLGNVNDEATAKRLLNEIVAENPALADAPAVVALREQQERARRQGGAAARHCRRRLRRLRPFWKSSAERPT